MTPRSGNVLSFCAAVAVGLAVSTGHPLGLAAAAGMPIVCLMQRTRKGAFETTLAHYTAGLWPMIPGLQRYIGVSASPLIPIAIWLIAAILLSLPWMAAWTDRSAEYLWRVPLALLATSVPPLGIIGFISPLAAAGYLFPSTAWVGLAAVWLLPGVLLAARGMVLRLRVAMFCLVFAVCGTLAIIGRVGSPAEAESIPGWVAVNTHFGDVSQPFRDYAVAGFIQQKAAASPARVLIFPEFVVPRWSAATEAFWQRTLTSCRARGQILALGAGLPSNPHAKSDNARLLPLYDFVSSIDALEETRRLPASTMPAGATSSELVGTRTESVNNAFLIVGAASATFYQRVPVPIGMWRPFTRVSVPLRLAGPGVVAIDGQRAAVLICYEEILTFPVLASMLQHPSVIIGISNSFWFDDTTIPQYQASALRGWARLFHLPLFMAVNS